MRLSYYIQLGYGKKFLSHMGIEQRSFRVKYKNIFCSPKHFLGHLRIYISNYEEINFIGLTLGIKEVLYGVTLFQRSYCFFKDCAIKAIA